MSKTLSSQQQEDLRVLLTELSTKTFDYTPAERGQITYWALELKPKRVRRKPSLMNPDGSVPDWVPLNSMV